MKAKSIRNLPLADGVTEENSVLIAQSGGIFRMLLRNFRRYIAYAASAELLGVPVPTAADAGKAPVVTEKGTYTMGYAKASSLIWKNPAPTADFPAQTIACDTKDFSTLIVILKSKSGGKVETAAFENDGYNAKVSVTFADLTTITEESRSVSADDTGVTFSGGTRTQYTGSTVSGSDYAIPIAIYGIA